MPTTVEITGNVARIVMAGNYDFSTQENLNSAFDQALISRNTSEIHIDMALVTFIDSSVIRTLLKLLEKARSKSKSLSILHCNERLREIFVIGGFDQIFNLR